MRRLSRVRQEQGFTPVELLVVLFIGSIVMAGVAGLVQVVVRQSSGVVSKTDASQRGRLAMDQITRALRSQVCLDLGSASARPALEAADRNSVTFFTDLSDGSRPPVRRQLSYDAANRQIIEREFVATSALRAAPTVFSTTPRTRVLLSNVTAPADGTDFFTFRRYTGTGRFDTDTVPVSGATALSAADRASVARITISMDVRPANARNAKVFTRLQDSVHVRNLSTAYSPTNPNALRCA
jgi:prepilin-type N-terminal cleavage/methylation domain-containing protein